VTTETLEDEEVLETSAEVESSEPPETLETQEASTTSEPPGGDDDGSSEPQEQDNVQEVGGVMEREYPNPDKEVGAITDLYDNINVFVLLGSEGRDSHTIQGA